MNILRSLSRKWRLWSLKKKGLQLSGDCRLMGLPNFGSEPYLISIGKNVTISSEVVFLTHDGGTWVFRHEEKYKHVIKYARIVVHENCFIGYRSIIMPGVSIGPNSVVAAGAVVTKDVPPGTVAAGVPAKVIMDITQYAERSLARTPTFDRDSYWSDKKSELVRLFPYPW